MKNFFTALCLILFISLTAQTNLNQTKDETTISIPDSGIDVILQVSDVTEQIRDTDNCQRLYLYDFAGDRYDSSIEKSGYSSDISINKQAISNTDTIQVQTSYSKFKQSGKRDTGGMLLRRTRAGSTDIQRNYDHASRSKYQTTRNYSANYQRAKLFTKSVFLVRRTGVWRLGNYDCFKIKKTNLNFV